MTLLEDLFNKHLKGVLSHSSYRPGTPRASL